MKTRMYRVMVAKHRVGRYDIEPLTMDLGALDRTHARLLAVREAHRRARVPPWKPWMRESWPHTAAELASEQPSTELERV